MSNKTMGEMISELRKEKGMTQSDLAEKMNVTDKAVSKWERDLACPDINSISTLAAILGVTTDELLNAKKDTKIKSEETEKLINLILKAVALAMGICVIVTSILKEIDMYSAFTLLAVGILCIAIYLFKNEK